MKYISYSWVSPLMTVLIIADWLFKIECAGNIAAFYLWTVEILLFICLPLPPEKFFPKGKRKSLAGPILLFIKVGVLVMAGWVWLARLSLLNWCLYYIKRKRWEDAGEDDEDYCEVAKSNSGNG